MRLSLAALVLLAVVASKREVLEAMRRNWLALVMLGLLNCAIPYTLITWGETQITSGLASIYNACAPLWAAGLGLFWTWGERLAPGRLFGVLMGLAGVMLIVGGNLGGGNDPVLHLLGQAAVLAAALSYAVSGIYARRMLRGVPSLAPATGQLVAGAIMLLPLAVMQVPTKMPSWQALGAVSTLAILGTALASLIYYWLLARVGAARTLLVTYLLPGFALMWGALLLHEPVTPVAVLGLALVLLGIAITTGSAGPVVRWLRARAGRAQAS
jgi:drug/metabolite transporter (DMT)-like permease